MNARHQSLQSLMQAMDDDESQKIPGVTIIIAGGEGMDEPDIEQSGNDQPLMPGKDSNTPDPMSPMPGHDSLPGQDDGSDPFEELLRRKKQQMMTGR